MNLRLLQSQSVGLPHIRVSLQRKHGDHAFGRHDDHIGVSHGALHYGRAQIHRDEVELVHCGRDGKTGGQRETDTKGELNREGIDKVRVRTHFYLPHISNKRMLPRRAMQEKRLPFFF